MTAPIRSADSALSVFLGMYPELARYPLIAVQAPLGSTGAAPGGA
ncbi:MULTISPECIES: hypothetical protein [unclassified Microbacterium]|nr:MULTISPECIES: hypothetical protein [unclassified Microbacterium]MCR2783772.1 hypothetical protein [Microbacterium sp. zg.B96]WIM15376.1 hypothetical protein QNO11_12635 [Microbacterium sp. zg-B96]